MPEENIKETFNQKVLGYVIVIFLFIAGYGAYQYFQLRGIVQDTVQEMLKEYPGVTVDGINLPVSLVVFAKKVNADVFIKRDNKDVTEDNIKIIEITIIPKDAIPVLSIFTGVASYVEISGAELLKLRNY